MCQMFGDKWQMVNLIQAISTLSIIAFCIGNFYIEILRYSIVRRPVHDEQVRIILWDEVKDDWVSTLYSNKFIRPRNFSYVVHSISNVYKKKHIFFRIDIFEEVYHALIPGLLQAETLRDVPRPVRPSRRLLLHDHEAGNCRRIRGLSRLSGAGWC